MVSLALINLTLKVCLLETLLLKHRCCTRSLVSVCFGSSLLCLAEFVAGQPLSHGGMALHDLLVDFSAWACAPPLLATGPPLHLSSSSTLLLSTPFVVCSSSTAVEYVRAFGHHLQSDFIGLRSCPMPRCGVILSCPVISLLACCGPRTRLGETPQHMYACCTLAASATWVSPAAGLSRSLKGPGGLFSREGIS